MDRRLRAGRKAENDRRRVLDVEFERRRLSDNGAYRARTAEHPEDVIEFVRAIQDDAASQIRARRVGLTVIVFRTPFRKVLTEFGPDPEQIAEAAALDGLSQSLDCRMEPK